jgi:hypothetical protein
MIVTQWIYPANCLILRRPGKPRRPLMEVRDRMAITVHSMVYTIRDSSLATLATVRHDLFTRRYEVRDAKGSTILYVATEKDTSSAPETLAWLIVAGTLMILAAVFFRVASVPGLPDGDKGEYFIWRPDAFRDDAGQPIGGVAYVDETGPQVSLSVRDDVASEVDRRVLLGLAAVVLTR